MKTTVEISDALFARAKRHARQHGSSLRALVEEGLRRVLDDVRAKPTYKMRDRSAGRASDANPLETMSWQDLRDKIYGGR